LEVSPRPSVVDAFVVAVIDVDDPTSWTLKDRYHVGGYPTLVAITPQGRELGRQVGYESFDATVTWMDNVIAGRVLQPVDAPTPEVAAQLAWQAVRDGTRDDVADWMKIASVQPELVPYRMARFHLEPSAEDAAWLRVHAPGESLRWVLPGRRAAAEDEALRQAMLHAIRDDLTRVSALDAADLLAVSAELSEPSVAAIQYGAAAALVRGELSGDDDLDKGLLGWLAYLTEHAGDPEGAVQILQDARTTWPDEPTFHVSLVRSYQRQARHEEALAVADRAVEVAWGDNLVNAARLRVISLVALDRVPEARAYVDDVLQRVPEPADGLDVRSHRMRQALRDAVPDAP
jgi:tetratricopeptide (TPR) repeat protein